MEEQEICICFRERSEWIRDEADGSAKEWNLVVAVPAGVEEHLLLPVLLGVQDVVAAMPRKRGCRQ